LHLPKLFYIFGLNIWDGMKVIMLIGCIFTISSAAAQLRIIAGVVVDTFSKEYLPSATLSINGKVISANGKGTFSVALPAATMDIKFIVSYSGYKTDTILFHSFRDNYVIELIPLVNRLTDVIVTTGVSKATSIKENPVPIVFISARVIDRAAEDNIIDALAQAAPGFNSVKTGPGVSKPFIHGLGYNRVLTLYDGVRQESQQWGDEHGIVVDDYNIDHAEIIKGPASLMYGSDALAGVMSLFPVMPYDTKGKLTGRYTSEYQSNNGLIGNGIRLIYGSGRWSYAVRGSYRIAKNYHDPVDGWVYNTNFRTTNASFTAQYRTVSGFTTLNINLYDHKQGIPDGSRDSLTRQFTKQIYEIGGQPDDNIKQRPLVPYDSLNSYLLSPLHQRIQDYKFYSNNHYEFGNGYLDGQLAFTQNLRREYDHPTNPDQAGLFVRLYTLNYGLRFTRQIFAGTEMTIGINGMYQNNKSLNATDFPIPDFDLLDVGPYFYLRKKWKRWTLSGGVRYDNRSLRGDNFYTKPDSVTGFFKHVINQDTTGSYLQFPAFNKTFAGFSFSAGMTYEVNQHISVKANIARGFRAPNISEFASNGLDPGAHIVYLGDRNALPEFSLQEDAGIEMTYNDVSVYISFFNNYIENYLYESEETDTQGNPVVVIPGNKTFRYEQSSAELFGFETTVNFHPELLRGFSFNNSFSLINGYNLNSSFKHTGVNGEYLPFMPPVRLVSGINQEIKTRSVVFTSVTLTCLADFNAAQNHYLALDHTETPTPAYTLINMGILSTIKYNKNYSLQFQVQLNNLLNTAYQSNQSRLKYFEYYTASPNGHLGIYGMGRNICAKLIMPL
jgi:iron complex outermembrane recepter protein